MTEWVECNEMWMDEAEEIEMSRFEAINAGTNVFYVDRKQEKQLLICRGPIKKPPLNFRSRWAEWCSNCHCSKVHFEDTCGMQNKERACGKCVPIDQYTVDDIDTTERVSRIEEVLKRWGTT